MVHSINCILNGVNFWAKVVQNVIGHFSKVIQAKTWCRHGHNSQSYRFHLKKEISQKSIFISIPLEICKTKKVEEMFRRKTKNFSFTKISSSCTYIPTLHNRKLFLSFTPNIPLNVYLKLLAQDLTNDYRVIIFFKPSSLYILA